MSAGFRAGAHRMYRVVEEGFHLQGEVNTLMMLSYMLPSKSYTFINILSFKASSASYSYNP
jgi:hypothetical protein